MNQASATSSLDSSPETARFGSGQSVKRLEDQQLLVGAGQYTNDVSLPNQSFLVFFRSPYPHAKITRLDTSAAKGMPGVHGLITGQDLLAAGVKPMARAMNFKRADGSPLSSTTRDPLATDTVRFVGEPIVAVVADTEENARNASEAIQIEFAPLQSASNLADALAPNAPLFTDAPDNRVAETRYGDITATQAAFAQAAHVTRLRIVNNRIVVCAMEPRSALAQYDAAQDRYTLHSCSQGVFGLRRLLAGLLNFKPEQLRVLTGNVGGSFGMKPAPYPEYACLIYAAKALGRPVKWTDERSDSFLSDQHGRDHDFDAELALAFRALACRALQLSH